MESLQIIDNTLSSVGVISTKNHIQNSEKVNLGNNALTHSINSKIDINNQSKFITKLTNNINRISNLQNIQSNILDQTNIINKINLNLQNSYSSKQLDNIQPTVKDLMDDFNNNSTIIDLNQIITEQDSEKSTAYFDGILGSKPLNPSDIMQEIQKKLEFLKSVKSSANNLFESTTKDVKNTINQEIELSQINSPLKQIDFSKESSNFTSKNIKNNEGSVVTSQANSSTLNAIKLLV